MQAQLCALQQRVCRQQKAVDAHCDGGRQWPQVLADIFLDGYALVQRGMCGVGGVVAACLTTGAARCQQRGDDEDVSYLSSLSHGAKVHIIIYIQ